MSKGEKKKTSVCLVTGLVVPVATRRAVETRDKNSCVPLFRTDVSFHSLVLFVYDENEGKHLFVFHFLPFFATKKL